MEVAQARLSLHLSKCHIVGNHMSWLIYNPVGNIFYNRLVVLKTNKKKKYKDPDLTKHMHRVHMISGIRISLTGHFYHGSGLGEVHF